MRRDLEALYDAHAHRLYAHCWSLLGDEGAPDAVRDVFAEAVRHPPQGETVLWLHRLSRSACAERGAFARRGRPLFTRAGDDPLMRAAAVLPADHREALLLAAGEWLDVRDIARVFRGSPGGVRELLHAARTLLERGVLEALMRGSDTASPYLDVIEAFEKGRLPNLLARRAPGLAPPGLRDVVLSSPGSAGGAVPNREVSRPATARTAQSPLVVIGSEASPGERRDQARRRRWAAVKGAGAVAGVAASVAAGLMMTWPSAEGDGVNALAPNQNNGQAAPPPGPSGTPSTSPEGTPPERGATDGTDGEAPDAPAPSPTAPQQAPATSVPETPAESPPDEGSPSEDPTTPPPSSTPGDDSSPDQDGDRDRDRDDGDGDDRRSRTGPIGDLVTGIVGSLTDPLSGGS